MNSKQIISKWIDLYSDNLLRIAFMYVKDRSTAEDRVQDTFIKAYWKLDDVPEPSNPLPLLTRILINVCHDARRKNWREIITSVIPERMSANSTEEVYLGRLNDQILHNAILMLPNKYRLPIVLFHFEEFSIQQISHALHISVGATKTRLTRGRKRLKELLKEERYNGQRVAECPPSV